jgi:hypothetical protein
MNAKKIIADLLTAKPGWMRKRFPPRDEKGTIPLYNRILIDVHS